jgi:hypothetical protein
VRLPQLVPQVPLPEVRLVVQLPVVVQAELAVEQVVQVVQAVQEADRA